MLDELAHYKILDRIGSGGMGEVYRARDTRLGRTVAIKVLPAAVADDPDRRERFLREARAAAALSHPNIAALYEVGEDDGQLFLVFEFVPGEPLSKLIAGRPLNPRRAIQFAAQVADALADAHAAGIVHRDIKPDNIVVTPKGNAKVLDFGLALWTAGGAAREQAATTVDTGVGSALGTLAYMSPEQARGEAVDERTDIFSFGVALYEMLTGSRPFIGATPAALVLQVVQKPVPPPSNVNRDVPIGAGRSGRSRPRERRRCPIRHRRNVRRRIADCRSRASGSSDTLGRRGRARRGCRRRPSRAPWLFALVAIGAASGAVVAARRARHRLAPIDRATATALRCGNSAGAPGRGSAPGPSISQTASPRT